MARIIEEAAFPWAGVPMRCQECKSVIAYDGKDLSDLFYPLGKFRESMNYGFEVVAKCRVCQVDRARFREVRDA